MRNKVKALAMSSCEFPHVCGWRKPEANSYIALSAGNEGGTVLPKAKKSRLNVVARAAAFRRRREQGRAGNGHFAVLPKAKKRCGNAVARETH
jgi:hypothetical protein